MINIKYIYPLALGLSLFTLAIYFPPSGDSLGVLTSVLLAGCLVSPKQDFKEIGLLLSATLFFSLLGLTTGVNFFNAIVIGMLGFCLLALLSHGPQRFVQIVSSNS